MNSTSTLPARLRGRCVVCLATVLAAAASFLLSPAGDAHRGAVAGRPASGPPLAELVNNMIGLERSTLVRLGVDLTPGAAIRTPIEIEGRTYTLDLVPHSVRTPGYRVLQAEADGTLTEVEPGPVNTLRGEALEAPGSVVAAGVLDDGLYGRVIFADGREYWFEPIAQHVGPGTEGIHVVYRTEDVQPHGFRCAASEANQAGLAFDDAPVKEAGDPLSGGQVFRCELGIDADNFYRLRWGANVESRINSVINSMNTQYERDTDIRHIITTIIIRTTDVYPTTDPSTMLGMFRDRWNANHRDVERDVAQLFTGRALNGNVIGIAFLSVICDSPITGLGYSLVQSDFNNVFSCATDLSAHELGHNWSAPHCDPCSSTMRSFIGCFNSFGAPSIAAIEGHRDTRTCLDSGPENDDCEDAFPVGNGSFAFNTLDATTDGLTLPESCNEGEGTLLRKDVWYRYTAPCTGTATASICNSTYNNRLAIYRDVTCPGDDLAACNDFLCGVDGNRAETDFTVSAGAQYLVRIGGRTETGSGTLVLSCVEGPVCPEDFDGDGEVGFGDLLALLSNWGPCGGPCPWDLDDDGEVGFSDLLQVLSVWGPCKG